MSWISNIFKSLGSFFNTSAGGSLLGAGSSILSGLFTSNQNKNLMREQNDFNAEQADINRQFQSKEAEIARDWQERFYQQYQSPQAMVHQYEKAGINPVLAAGHATNTPPAASSPSGSAASGVTPGYANVAGIMEQFGKLALLKAEINNINADTDAKKAGAAKDYSDISLNSQNIKESESRISKLIEETKSEDVRRGLMIAQTLLAKADAKVSNNQSVNLSYDILRKQFDEEFKDRFGTYPATNLYETIWNAIKGVTNGKLFGIEFGW